ncbi:MAG TPA: Ig-like domain-containing protein, partial [Bacillota bacterium]|nr:Ig-like domain-containing protein [Bacillota bacterium]
ITFSEAMNGFTINDINVTNGTASNFSGSGTTYSIRVTPLGQGQVTINVGEEVAQDGANNGNSAAAPINITSVLPVISTPPNGTYYIGQNLDFTVSFNQAVTVTGNPYIPLVMDQGGTVNAVYLSGSGTNTLTFRYVIATGNFDADGIAIAHSITTNDGTLKDGANNDIFLNFTGLGEAIGIKIDGVVPTVTSVTLPADKNYKVGDNLDFTVKFDEATVINPTGGVPYLPLTLDNGGQVQASYLSGSGTKELVFRYTVQNGNIDTNGVTVGSTIILNGGTVKDLAGNNAILTLNGVGSTAQILVDGIIPTVSAVTVPENKTYKIGENLDFKVTFNEKITVNPTGGIPYIPISLETGGTVQAVYLSGSGSNELLFRYTIQAGNLDTDGITVGSAIIGNNGALYDAAGNNANPELKGVGNTVAILIDGVTSAVVGVTLPEAKTYLNGQNLDFIINYDDVVTVDTANGVPYLALTLESGGTVKAGYVDGSGTNALHFRYTVQPGNDDHNGITLGNAITLNNGIIKDPSGNEVNLTLKGIGDTTFIKVDAVDPVVASVSIPANDIYTAGETLRFTVNFSEDVVVTGVDSSLSLDIGGVAKNAIYYSKTANSITYQYTVLAGDRDVDGISLTGINLNTTMIKDLASNAADVTLRNVGDSTLVKVETIAPKVTAEIKPDSTTATTVTVTGNVVFGGNATVTECGIEYKKVTDSTYTVVTAPTTGMGSYEINLTGLTASTVYNIRAYAKNGDLAYSNVIDFTTQTYTADLAVDGKLSETGLDGAKINVNLAWTTFKDTILSPANFTLLNATEGLAVQNVTYIDSTHCLIGLTFNGTDFDRDIDNLGLKINADELASNENLTSLNTLGITALNDSEHLMITADGSIWEGEENDAALIVSIVGGTFAPTLNPENWTLSNLPSGVTKGMVTRVNATTVRILLSGNAVADYDIDITNLTVSCTAAEYRDSTGGGILTVNNGVTLHAKTAPVVSTEEITNTTGTTALAGGMVSSAGAPVIERGIEYKKATETTYQKAAATAGTGEFNLKLKRLTPQSTYQARVYATNAEGTTYGNVVTFTTPAVKATMDSNRSMTEANLDVIGINIILAGTFWADNLLEVANFSLVNAPAGLTIESVS